MASAATANFTCRLNSECHVSAPPSQQNNGTKGGPRPGRAYLQHPFVHRALHGPTIRCPAQQIAARPRTRSQLSQSNAQIPLKEKGASLAADLKGTSLFLIGMMGSGKSTVGRVLADALGYCFFDSDEVVQQAAGGASVAQIFQENGEEAFREIETQVISELSSLGRLVVATGGGAIIRPQNWSYLAHGVTVFLDVPLEMLAARVVADGTASRPLLQAASPDGSQNWQPEQKEESYDAALGRLQRIFSARAALYRNADAVISMQELGMELSVPEHEVTADHIAEKIVWRISDLVAQRKEKDRVLRARTAG